VPDLRVLVVEDDPVAAEAHRTYVERLPGFTCVGIAGTAGRALQVLARGTVDVVLLDMNLPDGHGLDVVRRMRASGNQTDVVAVTSAREVASVQAAARIGVVQYVLKPFVFATLRERLLAYRAYREQVQGADQVDTQAEVDQVIGGLRAGAETPLPKGMSEELLSRVSRALREGAEGVSASELGDAVGVSRVTARRYAEFLCDSRLAVRRSRYAGPGRPEVEYRWSG
jgi:response regulator of citrate/malate metabolism